MMPRNSVEKPHNTLRGDMHSFFHEFADLQKRWEKARRDSVRGQHELEQLMNRYHKTIKRIERRRERLSQMINNESHVFMEALENRQIDDLRASLWRGMSHSRKLKDLAEEQAALEESIRETAERLHQSKADYLMLDPLLRAGQREVAEFFGIGEEYWERLWVDVDTVDELVHVYFGGVDPPLGLHHAHYIAELDGTLRQRRAPRGREPHLLQQ